VEGVSVTPHAEKASLLKGYYVSLLGTVAPTTWRFSLESCTPTPPRSLPLFVLPSPEMRSVRPSSP
jgi:hypothetical protein